MTRHPNSRPGTPLRRREAVLTLAGLALSAAPRGFAAAKPRVGVWKSPNCGCCRDWIAHLQANGFAVTAFDAGNTDVRAQFGMPLQYGACHTGRIDGYALEGHVPAREVHRLLREKPQALGLAVPAMPLGSPGMDGPEYGARRDPYDVLLVQRDGKASVYQSYR